MSAVRFINISLISIFLNVFATENVLADKPLAPENVPGSILVNADEVVKLIVNTPNLVVIDSRKEEEYIKGHIQGAISLPNIEMTPDKLHQLAPDKTTPLLFYCNGEQCLRSSRAAKKAINWHYKNVFWFRGGWSEWLELGMPISHL